MFAANDYVRIPNPISRAVEKLALGEPRRNDARPREDREWFVSAPGKVILFGEHAVVHGVVRCLVFCDVREDAHIFLFRQTAIAASVDLRCYGLTSPRHDGKLSVHLTDIGDYRHEWDVDDLPWDAVTPIPPGEPHPDQLDPRLMEAISARALPPADEMPRQTHGSLVAFLYLYMTLAHGGHR